MATLLVVDNDAGLCRALKRALSVYGHAVLSATDVETALRIFRDEHPQHMLVDRFVEYRLTHSGDVKIRNWEGGTLPAHMNGALIEHAKALATERVITNPPSSNDLALLDPYMKGELKGRPIEGSYALRFYETPSLRWERIKDMQLVWRYHYWTRFTK